MSDVYFILVEGLEDWPHPVPVAKCSGDENTACMLAEGLRSEFREEAPSLRFSFVRPTTPEGLLSLVSRLVGAHDEGEFGEQVNAVCRAAVRQWTFLEKWSNSKGNGGGVEAAGEHAVTPAPECGAVFPSSNKEDQDGAVTHTENDRPDEEDAIAGGGAKGNGNGGSDLEKRIEALTPLDKLCLEALRHFEKPINDTSLQTLAGLSGARKFYLVCVFWKDAKGLTPAKLRGEFVQNVGKEDYHLPDDKSGTERVRKGIGRGREILGKF